MPYKVVKSDKPRGWFVITTATGKKHSIKPFKTKAKAMEQMRALYANTNDIEGAGITDFLKKGVKAITSRLKAFKGVRLDYSPSIRQFLQSNGESVITGLTIYRSPVEKYVKTLANIVSLGKFKELLDKSYDEVYHLFLKIELNKSGTSFSIIIEKNAVISIKPFSPDDVVNAESYVLQDIPPNLTLNTFLSKAQASTSPEVYFKYDALTTNCQEYILRLLESNGLIASNPDAKKFIYQDMGTLKAQLPSFSQKIMKSITDLAGVADVAIKGYGLLNKPDIGF
jgi:hypothetical protein